MSRKPIVYALGLLALLPAVIAAPSVRASLQGFVSGIRTFTVSGFIDGLLAILPLVGLIAIVFGLMFFITRISIFRGEGNDKYARMVAIGVALLGLAQQRVFDTILGWSTTFLTLIFILAVIMMFLIFLNHSRTSHHLVATDLNKAQKDRYTARTEARKAKHESDKLMEEVRRDRKLFDKTTEELDRLDSNLQSIRKLSGNELQRVDKLAELLRSATAAATRGESGNVHEYVQALTREIGALVTTMQHDHRDLNHVHQMLNEMRRNIEYLYADEKDEHNVDAHLEEIFKRHLKHHHNHEVEKLNDDLLKEQSDLHKHLLSIRNAVMNLKNLENRLESHLESLEKYGYQAKHDAAAAVRDACLAQDFNEAHKQLDHLRSLIEHGRQQEDSIKKYEDEMRRYLSQINEHEKALKLLVPQIKKSLQSESRAERHEGSDSDDVRSEIKKKAKKVHDLANKANSEFFERVGNNYDSHKRSHVKSEFEHIESIFGKISKSREKLGDLVETMTREVATAHSKIARLEGEGYIVGEHWVGSLSDLRNLLHNLNNTKWAKKLE